MRAAGPALALLAVSGCGEGAGGNEAAAKVAIEPGLWEASSEIVDVRAPDLPHEVRQRMIGPRPTARGCIAAGQARRMIGGNNCTYQGFVMADGRLGGTLICPDPVLLRPTVATIEGRYEPRNYAFEMAMQTAMPDGATMRIEISGRGRRLGDCPPPRRRERKGTG